MGYGFNLTREGTDLTDKVSCSKGDVSIAVQSLLGPPRHVWLELAMKYHLLQSYIYHSFSPFPVFLIRSAQSRVILQQRGMCFCRLQTG